MTEELALDEVLRDRAAVDGHVGPGASPRRLVYGSRHGVLARPRLTLDEDRRVRAGDPLEQRVDAPHLDAASEHAAEALVRRELEGERLIAEVEPEHGVAHAHRGARGDLAVVHANAIHERPVRAPRVHDPHAVRADLEDALDAGDGRVRQAEVARRGGAEANSALADARFQASVRAGDGHEMQRPKGRWRRFDQARSDVGTAAHRVLIVRSSCVRRS